MNLRETETYQDNKFFTKRYENSAIPYAYNLLKKQLKEKHDNIQGYLPPYKQ